MDTFSDLEALLKLGRNIGWDGYDAEKINKESYNDSIKFLSMLPETILQPEVSLDPDGMVAFEWHREPRWVFSISFETEGKIAYAGLSGDEKIHGKDNFRNGIPESILDNILRALS